MGSWPDSYLPAGAIITPWSILDSIGEPLAMIIAGIESTASAAYPSANLAIYVPFMLAERATVTQMWCINGTTANSNIDVGVYASTAAGGPGPRIISKGPTAQSGTSVFQAFDITDTVLAPGIYYMAISCSATTGTFFAVAPNAEFLRAFGVLQQASAGTLPASATPATMAQAYLPVFGLLLDRSTL